MTPKEKALELIERFTFNCKECDNASLCALFTVDEILSVIENVNPIESQYNYWQQVKQEIEKL